MQKEYTRYSEDIRKNFLAVEFAEIFYKTISDSAIYQEIDKRLPTNPSSREKLDVLWKWELSQFVRTFSGEYAAAEFLLERNRKVYLFTLTPLAPLMAARKGSRIKVVTLPGSIFAAKALALFRARISVLLRRHEAEVTPHHDKGDIEETVTRSGDVEDCAVAYFPHMGVFYGDLFIKDYFYSEHISSPLLKTKIAHLSLGEKGEEYMRNSYKYYRENKIPFGDLYDLPYNRKELGRDIIRLLLAIHFRILRDIYRFGIDYILFSLILYYRLTRAINSLKKMKKLRLALIGYDYALSRHIAAALSLLNVKVCALQERLIQAFYPDSYMVFDYYFTASAMVSERGLKTSCIGQCVPVGLVRVDNLYRYAHEKIPDGKYDLIKSAKKLVLALDYHMPADDMENMERDPGCRITVIRKFYSDLLRLAVEFPSLYIAIKGKNTRSYQSPYLRDLVERIEGAVNMCIETDLKTYNPYYIAEKADLTIACHTSLADELLAMGRNVIIYETTDYLETLFNYDDLPIIVSDYEQLKHHIKNFLEGKYLDQKTVDKIKGYFYSNCDHGKVRGSVQTFLERIMSEERPEFCGKR